MTEEDVETKEDTSRKRKRLDNRGNDSAKESFVNLLGTFGGYHSTDPRDRIYALLRLAQPPYQLLSKYEKSTQEVYLDVIKAEISHAQTLRILMDRPWSNRWFESRPQSWSTWASRMFEVPQHQYCVDQDNFPTDYHAAGYNRPQTKIYACSKTLVLQGITFDKLSWLSGANLLAGYEPMTIRTYPKRITGTSIC